jgi:colicin import membrane protein
VARKPGVILRRPVGSDGPFGEDADLPTPPVRRRAQPQTGEGSREAKVATAARDRRQGSPQGCAGFRVGAGAGMKRPARRKECERRRQTAAKALAALDKNKREHDRRAATIEAERAAVEKRSQAEETRWEKQKEKLETALRRREPRRSALRILGPRHSSFGAALGAPARIDPASWLRLACRQRARAVAGVALDFGDLALRHASLEPDWGQAGRTVRGRGRDAEVDVATLAVFVMTLFIQRANRRDNLALHAKLDEPLRVDRAARSELTQLDEQEPEVIERHRDEEVRKSKVA